MARNARRDAIATLDVLIALGTEAFANVARGVVEDPKDEQLAALLDESAARLERFLRLRQSLGRA